MKDKELALASQKQEYQALLDAAEKVSMCDDVSTVIGVLNAIGVVNVCYGDVQSREEAKAALEKMEGSFKSRLESALADKIKDMEAAKVGQCS